MAADHPQPAMYGELSAIRAFRLIVRDCLERFSANVQQFGDAGSAEALHQSRVALRQLRTVFALFRPLLDRAVAARFDGEMRWIMGQLADARNLDVLLAAHVDEGDASFRPLVDRLRLAREAAYAQALAAVASRRLQHFAGDLGDWLNREDGEDGRTIGPFAAASLAKQWRRIVAAGDPKKLSASDLHRLRIRVKKLRYALVFFDPLFPPHPGRKAERFRSRLGRLQDCLGAINDMTVAEAQVRAMELTPAEREDGQRLFGGNKGGRKKLLKRAAKLHHKLARAKPFWRALG